MYLIRILAWSLKNVNAFEILTGTLSVHVLLFDATQESAFQKSYSVERKYYIIIGFFAPSFQNAELELSVPTSFLSRRLLHLPLLLVVTFYAQLHAYCERLIR